MKMEVGVTEDEGRGWACFWVALSVRGRLKSVGRGRFLTTDRPVDFKSTDRKRPLIQFSRNFLET